MTQYIDKIKIEIYNVSPQVPSVGIVYNPKETYNINNQVLTEAEVIVKFDLILISKVFYTKPFITIIIGDTSVVKKFSDDAVMNIWINDYLTPLNFLVI